MSLFDAGYLRLASIGCATLVFAAPWGLRAAVATPSPPIAPPFRAPYLPHSNEEVLQEVPAASNPQVRKMVALRRQLDGDQSNALLADQLAQAYIDFGRTVGDAHYVGYAEAVLAPWLAKPTPPVAALIDYGTILQYRHQFSDARVQFERALALDPRNAQGWLSVATLDMVQGDYAAATKDCSQLGMRGGLQLSIACTASLRSYLGHAEQSVTLLQHLAGDSPGLSPSFKAWIEGLLAESFERLGDWPQVEAHYRKALAFTPDDNFLQVAYADFLLDQHRDAEVLTLLARSAQSDTAFLRLALAKSALHQPDAPLYTWIMAARFEAVSQRGSDYFGREQVRFALLLQHDPATALDLAQRNWQVQRAPWDARVFLEAALASDAPQTAASVIAFVQETHLQDPHVAQLIGALEARRQHQEPSSGRAKS